MQFEDSSSRKVAEQATRNDGIVLMMVFKSLRASVDETRPISVVWRNAVANPLTIALHVRVPSLQEEHLAAQQTHMGKCLPFGSIWSTTLHCISLYRVQFDRLADLYGTLCMHVHTCTHLYVPFVHAVGQAVRSPKRYKMF